jgi:hypothetical protein
MSVSINLQLCLKRIYSFQNEFDNHDDLKEKCLYMIPNLRFMFLICAPKYFSMALILKIP